MQIHQAPKPPKSLTGDRIAQKKYKELCSELLEDQRLTSGSIHAIELIALTYSQWLKYETKCKADPDADTDDTDYRKLAVKAKNDLFRMLKDLGLVNEKKKAPASAKKPTPITASATALPETRPRLRIVRRPSDISNNAG